MRCVFYSYPLLRTRTGAVGVFPSRKFFFVFRVAPETLQELFNTRCGTGAQAIRDSFGYGSIDCYH